MSAKNPSETAAKIIVIANSTTTWAGVSISSHIATQVLDNSSNEYRAVYVENEDATANIRCSERSNTANSGAARGKQIKAGKWFALLIPYYAGWYCINDSGSGDVDAMIGKTK